LLWVALQERQAAMAAAEEQLVQRQHEMEMAWQSTAAQVGASCTQQAAGSRPRAAV
jgi:hypothetical protein